MERVVCVEGGIGVGVEAQRQRNRGVVVVADATVRLCGKIELIQE